MEPSAVTSCRYPLAAPRQHVRRETKGAASACVLAAAAVVKLVFIVFIQQVDTQTPLLVQEEHDIAVINSLIALRA